MTARSRSLAGSGQLELATASSKATNSTQAHPFLRDRVTDLEQLVALQEVSDSLGCIALVFNNLSRRACFNFAYSHHTLARSCFTNLRGIDAKVAQAKLGECFLLGSHNALHSRIDCFERAANDSDNGGCMGFETT